MGQTEKRGRLITDKLLYTAIIILVYLAGRAVPLYGVDISAYADMSGNAQILLVQTISGDVNRYSLFALGISPYMISSILVQIMVSCKNAGSRVRISPGKTGRMQMGMTLAFASVQAVLHVHELKFRQVSAAAVPFLKGVAAIEMVTGVMIILWLSSRNKRYGLGGQTALIYVNILDGILGTLSRNSLSRLALPLGIAAVVMVIMIVMESGEKRIPVQRISIHNIYGDKNYLAIKMNPMGVMPVMFSTAFFMVPQFLVLGLSLLFPDNIDVAWWKENLTLIKPLGIVVYILILYVLTISFSMIFISPSDIADQFLKSGDSIMNLHAGRDTRRYLSGQICRIGFASATVMSICLGIPMFLQLKGTVDKSLVMFPASIMMMTSIWYNLYQEFLAVKSYDSYKPFI